MLALVLAAVVAAAIVLIASVVTRRPGRADEIERFHRARQMTTEWARAGVTRPIFADEAAAQTESGDPDLDLSQLSNDSLDSTGRVDARESARL